MIWKKYYEISDGNIDCLALNDAIKVNPNTPPVIVHYLNNK